MKSDPWLKFYPSDWRADPNLRMCSLEARGLWMEMLCLMHEADGFLCVNGTALAPLDLAKLAGISKRTCQRLLNELQINGVFSVDESGKIFSRRILKDLAKSAQDRANGRLGGNPNLRQGVNPSLNGEDKAQKPEARSQKPEKKESERAPSPTVETSPVTTGDDRLNGAHALGDDHPLPEGFALTADLTAFSLAQGFSHDDTAEQFAWFVDYYRAAPGRAAVRRDWGAVFRNWIREAARRRVAGPRGAHAGGSRNANVSKIELHRRAIALVSHPPRGAQ
jgi:hypothetical protein